MAENDPNEEGKFPVSIEDFVMGPGDTLKLPGEEELSFLNGPGVGDIRIFEPPSTDPILEALMENGGFIEED